MTRAVEKAITRILASHVPIVSVLGAVALLHLAACSACTGSGEGYPDDKLGGLVVADAERGQPVELERAAREPAELARALALGHDYLAADVGAHRFAATSTLRVSNGDALLEQLTVENHIDYAASGDYAATSHNDHDYGRDILYVDGQLYLRPRYGKYHQREPVRDSEPASLRNELFSELAAQFELLAPGVELSDAGAAQHAGRAARKIVIAKAPKATAPPKQPLEHQRWRQTAVVEDVNGWVLLDIATGAPLSAALDGVVSFMKEGQRLRMKLHVEHDVRDLGTAVPVAAPPAEATVATHERSHEVEERNRLLEGLAPPARNAPTPQNPSGRTAPAAVETP